MSSSDQFYDYELLTVVRFSCTVPVVERLTPWDLQPLGSTPGVLTIFIIIIEACPALNYSKLVVLMIRRSLWGCPTKFGHPPDMGIGRPEIRSDQDRPIPKSRPKFVRTAGEPPPLFSGVLGHGPGE